MMMNIKTEKTFVVRMTSEEAGIMLGLLGLVGGPPNSVGRTVTEAMLNALEQAGAVKIDAFEDDSKVVAKDIAA